MTAADPRDGLHGLVADWLAGSDEQKAEANHHGTSEDERSWHLGCANTLKACANELKQALAHARPEAVDEAMVERAFAAYKRSRGSYDGEVPVHREDIHAALIAALTPERAP